MQRWEYKVVEVQVARWFTVRVPEDLGVHMDQMGAQGWELVRVQQVLNRGWIGGSYTEALLLFFRRPLA